MKKTTTAAATKKTAAKPTKVEKVKGRIERTEAVIAKYDLRRAKRLDNMVGAELCHLL